MTTVQNSTTQIEKIYQYQVEIRRLSELPIKLEENRMFNNNQRQKHVFSIAKQAGVLNSDREKLLAIYLTSNLNIIGFEVFSIGDNQAVHLHEKEFLRGCIASCAERVMLVHNHPMGAPVKPSKGDNNVTKVAKKLLNSVGLELWDHAIINDKGEYYSYADVGKV